MIENKIRLPKINNSKMCLEEKMKLVPPLGDIKNYFNFIFSKSRLESDCIIMSLIYIERLAKETKGGLCIRYDNWKSLIFACLVMSSKVWDDLSMWNIDFSQICPGYDLRMVNSLELAMLEILKYSIRVRAGEYAKYYFHLRSMMARLGLSGDEPNWMKPLDVNSAKRLDLQTKKMELSASANNSNISNINHDGGFSSSSSGNGNVPSSYDDYFKLTSTSPDCKDVDFHGIPNLKLNRSISLEYDLKKHSYRTLALEEIVHPDHLDADGAIHRSTSKTNLSALANETK